MSVDKKSGEMLKIAIPLGLLGLALIAVALKPFAHRLAVLSPKGTIAQSEKDLIIFATVLSLFVVIPVYALTFYIAWNYREGNKHANYQPNWDRNALAETVWWGIPTILIVILSVVTWNSTHALDPKTPISSSAVRPINIEVVALQWKWLFIYPEQNIATVNYLNVPINTPIDFHITADAPMNSFWVPELGGQIYAMSGMSTELHLMASQKGSFAGSSANISGQGFAGMKFRVNATAKSDFDSWVSETKKSGNPLTARVYTKLAKPSDNLAPLSYSSSESNLYNQIVMKYMIPGRNEGAGL